MTQLGEAISVDMFIDKDEEHNEKTCPWHTKAEDAKDDPIEPENPAGDGDDPEIMPENKGGKLGDALLAIEKEKLNKAAKGKKAKKPVGKVTLKFAVKQQLTYKGEGTKKKDGTYRDVKVTVYEPGDEEEYKLQYAAHHLIPGNESLKESELALFLGDDAVIKHFNASGEPSFIKKGQSTGYDVNSAENGVWLPTPYALSNRNKWPSIKGKEYIFRDVGERYVEYAVSFQEAYIAAAIEASGGKQFHMRHSDYSREVKFVLNGMAEKMKMMIGGQCEVAEASEEDDKIDAPKGLIIRLNVLSAQLARLLTGNVWHKPFFADNEGMNSYMENLDDAENPSADIKKIM